MRGRDNATYSPITGIAHLCCRYNVTYSLKRGKADVHSRERESTQSGDRECHHIRRYIGSLVQCEKA